MSVSCLDHVYFMQLASGQAWYLTATAGAGPWLDKLATILELGTGESDGRPKLIFTRAELGKTGCSELIRGLDPKIWNGLPGSGWKAHNLYYLELWSHPDVSDVVCNIGHEERDRTDIFTKMCFSLRPIYLQSQLSGGLPLHAALVERDGIAVLLAAPSNTGKSTCCRRLPSPWHALCDDQTLVVRDKRKRYVAHPFPTWKDYMYSYSQRTWDVQQHFPLSAIFFLEQAETDTVIRIGQGQSAILINQSTSQIPALSGLNLDSQEDMAFRKKFFDNACELARTVPAFILHVSLNGRFWDELEKVVSVISEAIV